VLWCIAVWGIGITGFGVTVALAGHLTTLMLVLGLVFMMVAGAGDVASAAIRSSMLQSAADENVRGRLQGVFTVVVAGGPRIADVVHGGAAAVIGTAATTTGGGILVIVGILVCAVLVPSFVRYRVVRRHPLASA
jgi:hypothetical protein